MCAIFANAWGRREMKSEQFGVVVQLVRIPACHAGGRGFESRPLRHVFKLKGAPGALLFMQEKRRRPFVYAREASPAPVCLCRRNAPGALLFMQKKRLWRRLCLCRRSA